MKTPFNPTIASALPGRNVIVRGVRGCFGGAGRQMHNGNPGAGGATP